MKVDEEIGGATALRERALDDIPGDDMAQLNRTSSSRRRPSNRAGALTTEHSPEARNAGTDQLNNRLFFRLFQLGNELQRQAVQQLGITTVQWAARGALSQERFALGIPFGQLGDYLVVTRQNLDGVIKRLERDGLAGEHIWRGATGQITMRICGMVSPIMCRFWMRPLRKWELGVRILLRRSRPAVASKKGC